MINYSFWKDYWLNVVSGADYYDKKSRGKAYFKNGCVQIKNVTFGCVDGLVQGSVRRPYKVEIRFNLIADKERKKIEQILDDYPGFRKELEQGKWSVEFFNEFIKRDVKLFHQGFDKIDCSCPDRSNPCKHALAVMYAIADYVELNPKILFTLVNCDPFHILHGLSANQKSEKNDLSHNPIDKLKEFLNQNSDFKGLENNQDFLHQVLLQLANLKNSQQKKKIEKRENIHLIFSDTKKGYFLAEIIFADRSKVNNLTFKEAQEKFPEIINAFKDKIDFIATILPAFKDYDKNPGKIAIDFASFQHFFEFGRGRFNWQTIKFKLPASLMKLVKPYVSLELRAHKKLTRNRKNLFKLDSLTEVCWEVSIGKQIVRLEDFRIASQKVAQNVSIDNKKLLFFNGQHLVVDTYVLDNFLEDTQSLPLSLSAFDMLQAVLAGEVCGFKATIDKEIVNLCQMLQEYDPVAVPKNLKAILRPYQQRGFAWLVQNLDTNLGSILADDMGLGKTLQVIAAIQYLKNEKLVSLSEKVLIVAPTGVLTNWKKEIERFAPDLKVFVYHGPKRSLKSDCEIVLTSYGVARSDYEKLNNESWQLLVIDEAQNIKNNKTDQTKALKMIKANRKIAMSGTPVENRLLEYWSIFDFTNVGYLGSAKQFQQSFATPIERDKDSKVLNRFRKITQPFILRRVKTDPSIIQDLPDKIENNHYCSLTPEQVALYEDVSEGSLIDIDKSEGITRKGLVFALINSLKQICNHPSQYRKEAKAKVEQSGKMQMLETILEGVDYTHEKVLIFTQYVQMGNILTQLLEEKFDFKVPFLHGGLSRIARDEIVDAFQQSNTSPILLVSLKAGGVGLNLTAANHVIHYDLWWNPAVEAQATDRAYRIGQQRNVMVHRLLTTGTLEEEIDAILMSKKELSSLTVGSGEQWVTEMTNAQLKQLVKLRMK